MATTPSTWTIDPERGAIRYQASQTRLRCVIPMNRPQRPKNGYFLASGTLTF